MFDDLLGLGLPEIAGIFTEVAAQLAYEKPDEPAVLQGYALLPDIFKPPVPVTNEALLGYAFDETTSPAGFELIRIRAGRLAAQRRPARLADGELTPIRRFARAWAAERPNAHAVVLLQAPAPRRGRDEPDCAAPRPRACSGCGPSTRARSTCRCTRTAPT